MGIITSYIQVEYVAHVKDAETVMQKAISDHRFYFYFYFFVSQFTMMLLSEGRKVFDPDVEETSTT